MSMRTDQFRERIAEAKGKLPLPDLLRAYGLNVPANGRGNMPSPFSKPGGRGKSPSFSIFVKDGRWGWKDRTGGGDDGGDEITFVERFEGVSRAEAIRRYLDKANIAPPAQDAACMATAANAARRPARIDAGGGFDWQQCVAAFTGEHGARLAEWRGFSPAFVSWLHSAELIGLWSGMWAFPVAEGGRIIAAHYRCKDGGWRYHPAGQGTHPLVIGDLTTAGHVAVFESQWDAFAVMDRIGWHHGGAEGWAVFITRGAGNGTLAAAIPAGRTVYAFPQNDEEKGGARAGDKWLAAVTAAFAGPVCSVAVPPEHKDPNDWLRTDPAADVRAVIEGARAVAASPPESAQKKADVPECDPAAVAEAAGVYWLNDSDRYFLPGRNGKWLGMGTAELRRILKTEHGVSSRTREGELSSDMDRVLVHINRHRSVDYAASLAGWNAGVYDMGGGRVIVRDSPRLIQPAEGKWPTIAGLIYGLLKLLGCDQVPHFMAWLKTAYESLLNGTCKPGQAVIFCGDADSGKSRLQHNIITPLIGGRNADPKSYFFGRTDFNAELIGSEHLLIEEIPAITRYDDRNAFGERIKEVVVNDTARLHKKNRDAFTVSIWQRLTISLNDDQMRALPPMTTGLMDKLMLFQTQRAPAEFWEQFAGAPDPRAAFREAIARELPAFAYDLLLWEIPPAIRGRRFGVSAFHNLDLLEELFESEPECLLLDMIDRELFGNPARRDPSAQWEGGAIDLENYLKADEMKNTVMHQARKLLSFEQACCQNLAKLRKRFPHRVQKPDRKGENRERRVWRIFPPPRS